MESELKKKLERTEKLVKIDQIITGDKNSPRAIRAYYHINHIAFRKFHSDRGFMHFRVSKSGKIESGDVFYQPDVISSLCDKGANVLELGVGMGANIFYLSEKRPDVKFTGIDLVPPKVPRRAPLNLRILRGNYSDLKMIESDSVDLVFGIETIVHNSDKDKIFSEVSRVLKRGGKFVVYDYATLKETEEYEPYEQTVIDIISKAGACARIESESAWNGHFERNGFVPFKVTDIGAYTLPDIERLERIARRVMDHDLRVRLVFSLLPKRFTGNILIGYLGADSYKEKVFTYYEWIYEKK